MTSQSIIQHEPVDSSNKIIQLLDFIYEKAIHPVAGLDSAQDLAQSYLQQDGSLYDKINSLIRNQNFKSAGSGFMTNLGGMITLPVAIPANFTSVLFVQLRMIAAIAHLCGYDVHNRKVKTLIYVALCGSAVSDLLKDVDIRYSTQLTANMLNKYLTAEVIKSINKAIGFRLLSRVSTNGVLHTSKFVPILGGLVAGGLDAMTTNIIGNTARDMFLGQTVDTRLAIPPKS